MAGSDCVGAMTCGARVHYTYDAVRILTRIAQKNASGETLLQMDYTYTNDDLPLTITESVTVSGLLTMTARVQFSYDTRRRLVQEVRQTYDSSPAADARGPHGGDAV